MNHLNVVFRLCFVAVLLAVSTLSQAQVIAAPLPVLSLKTGWNLVGNSANKAIDVAAVFASKSNEVQSVWHWNTTTSNWEFYTPSTTVNSATYAASRGYGDLKSVPVGDGFWVNVSAANGLQLSLPFEGSTKTRIVTATPVSNLKAGWNLVGNHSNKAIDVAALYGAVTQVSSVWKWNGTTGKWDFYSPQLTAADLASYATSKGYGVLANIAVGDGYWVSVVDAKQVSLQYDLLPLPVYATSVENQNSYNIGRIDFSALTGGLAPTGPGAFGLADFFRTGNLDVFTTNVYAPSATAMTEAQAAAITADPKYWGDLSFWRRGEDGKLTLIKEYKNAGCITGRKAAVADLNQDGYPDVVIGCHGLDAIMGPDGNQIIPGEYSKLLLSDGKGGFTISNIGAANSFAAGISAGDINGDGYPDIMFPDGVQGYWADDKLWNSIQIYINNKDGTFHKDETRFPTLTGGTYFEPNDLVDVDGDGILDAVVGGGERHTGVGWEAYTAILYGDKDGTFGKTRRTDIPTVKDRHVVLQYVLIVEPNGKRVLYLDRTSQSGSPVGYYNTQTIQKYDVATGASTIVYDSIGENSGPIHWFTWVLPKMCSDGQMGVVPYSSKTAYMDPTYPDVCIH